MVVGRFWFSVFCKSDEGQWENKQISFPDNISFTKAGKYTLQYTLVHSRL